MTLTQFELRLDLAYVADDIKHAGAWLDHEDTMWSLKSVEKKIKMLFGVGDERTKLADIFRYLSGIKHGNPVFSELGFPARISGREIEISTGEISDTFSKDFTDLISAYSTYQLAWSSQVLNVCTGKYAMIDTVLREKVRGLAVKLHPIEDEFRKFLKSVVDSRPRHFGIKKWKRTKNS